MSNTIEQQLIDSRTELLFRINPFGELVGINEPAEPNHDQAPKLYLFLGGRECIIRKNTEVREGWFMNFRSAVEQTVGSGDHTFTRVEEIVYSSPLFFKKDISLRSCSAFYIPKAEGIDQSVVEIGEYNKSCLQQNFPYAHVHFNALFPLVAKVAKGDAVAICRTVRRHSLALECGVDTVAEFRGKGFGAEVVKAWAKEVRKRNLIPCYSVDQQNIASLAIVRKIGMNQYGTDVTIDWP